MISPLCGSWWHFVGPLHQVFSVLRASFSPSCSLDPVKEAEKKQSPLGFIFIQVLVGMPRYLLWCKGFCTGWWNTSHLLLWKSLSPSSWSLLWQECGCQTGSWVVRQESLLHTVCTWKRSDEVESFSSCMWEIESEAKLPESKGVDLFVKKSLSVSNQTTRTQENSDTQIYSHDLKSELPNILKPQWDCQAQLNVSWKFKRREIDGLFYPV